MSKRAFTLIELMIVIAVLGIGLLCIYPSIGALVKQGKLGQQLIDEAGSLTGAYAAIKTELAKCSVIVDCDFDRVLFNDDHVLRVARTGQKIVVGNKEYRLKGRARIKDLLAIDNKSFSTVVYTGSDKITVIWRVGEENAK